ncbi:MAG: S8 family peptidase, partial [Promethearchaeota archaeon]
GFNSLIENLGGKIVDNLIRHNFCLLRIHMDQKIMDEIIELKEIALIDRPPYHRIVEELLETDIEDLEIKGSPPENNAGILIVDSGIRSGHPLLSNAVADEISIATRRSTKILNDDPTDDVGHGTMVSGIALYGDISKCIVEKIFEPKIWIFSSKVMYKDEYGRSSYDPEELLEHQLEKAVKTFVTQYPNCKIVNISFGNDIRCFKKGMRQFNLAALIDELSKELNIIFVVSAGNSDVRIFENYLSNFLNNENEDVKIIDPATSALSLTVGASCFLKGKLFDREAISPTTRVGPGIRGMIKPELIENGGYGYGKESDIVVLNPNWIEEGRLFTQNSGTSFSAPKISHILALLINKYRTTSLNLIKAILISSTSISNDIIKIIKEIDTEGILDILDPIMITGYGMPNLDKSLFSYDNHVLLIRENKIKLNNVHIYPIFIPKSFITEKGERSISVSLAFDPPVNKNRADYLGCTLEAKLYRNIPPEEIQNYYQTVNIEEEEDDKDNPKKRFEKLLKKNQIDLKPNLTTRKLGVHQKCEITFRRSPKIDTNIPLTLVIINRNRWIGSEDYNQDYGVVLTLEHKAMIDLYNEIRILIRERARVQTKSP